MPDQPDTQPDLPPVAVGQTLYYVSTSARAAGSTLAGQVRVFEVGPRTIIYAHVEAGRVYDEPHRRRYAKRVARLGAAVVAESSNLGYLCTSPADAFVAAAAHHAGMAESLRHRAQLADARADTLMQRAHQLRAPQ